MPQRYVLVTPAYNEELLITQTIESVLAQTILPERWVIVDDASSDATGHIVAGYARKHSFIQPLRVTTAHARDFGRRIRAVNLGCAELENSPYEYLGSLDADVSFGPNYFRDLISRFKNRPRLGLASGSIHETDGGGLKPLQGETERTVPNAAQLFRRACYEAVGGYPFLPYGGPDTYAEVMARMKGWEVETFEDLIVNHHRCLASAGGLIRGRFRQGRKDYSFGYHPLFEIFKCARRLPEKPVVVGGAVRFAGYCWSLLRRDNPAVSEEFVAFLRKEQLGRIFAYIHRAGAAPVPRRADPA